MSLRFLELLAKMEGKTRNAHLDKVLSVLNMMMHTYRDRHEVEHWYVHCITINLVQSMARE